jgi:hypothetical protein
VDANAAYATGIGNGHAEAFEARPSCNTVETVNRASFIGCVEFSPLSPFAPSARRKEKTCSPTTVYISAGAMFLNRDHLKFP